MVNDGLGDDLRTAFQKVNANFTALSGLANAITAVNITAPAASTGYTTGYSIFTGLTGSTLGFKALIPGSKIAFTDTPDAIVVSNTATMFSTIATSDGSIDANRTPVITFAGDSDISITLTQPVSGTTNPPAAAIPGVVNIRSVTPVSELIKTYDFGSITGEVSNIFQLYLTATFVDFGSIPKPAAISIDLGAII